MTAILGDIKAEGKLRPCGLDGKIRYFADIILKTHERNLLYVFDRLSWDDLSELQGPSLALSQIAHQDSSFAVCFISSQDLPSPYLVALEEWSDDDPLGQRSIVWNIIGEAPKGISNFDLFIPSSRSDSPKSAVKF